MGPTLVFQSAAWGVKSRVGPNQGRAWQDWSYRRK